MPDMELDSKELRSDLSEAKSFDLRWEPDEEILPEYCGISTIKESSGIICFLCMKFFLDEVAAKEHTRNVLHYQHCCTALHKKGMEYDTDASYTVDALYGEYSYEEDRYHAKKRSNEIEGNDDWVTIKKCSGILCSTCSKVFVSEASAGQHVKSWAHYKKYNDWMKEDNTLEEVDMKPKFITEDSGDNFPCIELKTNKKSSGIMLGSMSKSDFSTAQSDEKNLKNTQESQKCEDSDIQNIDMDPLLSIDNDWWSEFDEQISTLLQNIEEDS